MRLLPNREVEEMRHCYGKSFNETYIFLKYLFKIFGRFSNGERKRSSKFVSDSEAIYSGEDTMGERTDEEIKS